MFRVERKIFNDECTIGEFSIDDVFKGYSIEDKIRFQNGDITKKVPGKTCIDAGIYDVTLRYSPHFQRDMPHVENVPCFTSIEIHGGNTADDTDGCICVAKFKVDDTHIKGSAELVQEIINYLKINGTTKIQIINETAL